MDLQWAEKRQAPRFAVKASAVVRRWEGGAPMRARVVNASSSGLLLAVKTDTPLEVGTQLVCEINIPDGIDLGLPSSCAGRVVRVDGEYAGVRLDVVS